MSTCYDCGNVPAITDEGLYEACQAYLDADRDEAFECWVRDQRLRQTFNEIDAEIDADIAYDN